MKYQEAIAFLTRCADDQGRHWYQGREWSDVASCPTCHGTNDAGWLHTPCSRYGSNSAQCAPVAYRVARIDGDTSPEHLDHVMSQVVNDHDGPQDTLREYARGLAGANVTGIVHGYLTCQLWAQLDYMGDEDDGGNYPTLQERGYGLGDISDGYVAEVTDEIEALVTEHPLAVRMYLNARRRQGLTYSDAVEAFGHDYYLTREGHGAGFWDRGLGDLGDYLTQVSKWAGAAQDLSDYGDGTLS